MEKKIINVSVDTSKLPKRKKKEPGVNLSQIPQFGRGQRPKKEEKPKREESILEWFDRSMEEELTKRRTDVAPKIDLPLNTGMSHPHMVESAAGGIDIQAGLRGGPDTELLDAVDKFAKAEAIVSFEGAVRAAERAAARVPPEMAEEAAVEGVKGYQAELTTIVKQQVPGARPVEVIGYVGITRPKYPKAKHICTRS